MFDADRQAASQNVEDAERLLFDGLLGALQPIEEIAERLGKEWKVPYMHMDTSIAPGIDTPPISDSFKALGIGGFGAPGEVCCCSYFRQCRNICTRMYLEVKRRLMVLEPSGAWAEHSFQLSFVLVEVPVVCLFGQCYLFVVNNPACSKLLDNSVIFQMTS